jgi:ATP adenylyltransferase/5',5'''-P-1,P-4-tetraphosphate phosphorylase II
MQFNVVKHHVLVVTRVFESQQDPLNARDLEAAWKVLKVGEGLVLN